MGREALAHDGVHEYYRACDWNRAVATLCVLAEVFRLRLSDQVLDAALGMHRTGDYRAPYGLGDGALMLLGVLGHETHTPGW